jgi:hypothetical protein
MPDDRLLFYTHTHKNPKTATAEEKRILVEKGSIFI